MDNPIVIASIISALGALTIAIWSYFTNKKTNKSLEEFKSELADKKADKDARREYEFEAKKRLYHEFEPLLFQLVELSDHSIHRIQSLARSAKHGNLTDDNGWLSQFNYYTKSTIYKLLAPLAVFQLMQKRVTLVDLNTDHRIEIYYLLTKQLYLSYTDDFEFARLHHSIDYDPNNIEWEELRTQNPTKYWRQGLPMGLLDKCVDMLLEKDDTGQKYLISYGEFERKIGNISNKEKSDIHLMRDIFFNFHPHSRPVLWRILIAQYQILNTILELKKLDFQEVTDSKLSEILLNFSNEDLKKCNWSQQPATDEIKEPFKVAIDYLGRRFKSPTNTK